MSRKKNKARQQSSKRVSLIKLRDVTFTRYNTIVPPGRYEVTTMRVVADPVIGKFYAIDWNHDYWRQEEDIALLTGRRDSNFGLYGEQEPLIHAEIPAGSMVCYLGSQEPEELRFECYYVGYDRYFGFVNKKCVMFYDLGAD